MHVAIVDDRDIRDEGESPVAAIVRAPHRMRAALRGKNDQKLSELKFNVEHNVLAVDAVQQADATRHGNNAEIREQYQKLWASSSAIGPVALVQDLEASAAAVSRPKAGVTVAIE